MEEMTPLFKKGQSVRLVKDVDSCGVEGFNIGEVFVIDDCRLRNDTVQYFFKGNVHAYYAECFKKV